MRIASIDIGSTWTKAALFRPAGSRLVVEERAAVPTTPENLAHGFFRVLEAVTRSADYMSEIHSRSLVLRYSSSAKGGLGVAAVGLVPSLTLEAATQAAHSAGAKLTHVLPYSLTRGDIARLEGSPPDIILLTGGTDGGDRTHVTANARALAASGLDCPIVYAGNRAARDEVTGILRHRHVVVADNVLPAVRQPAADSARRAIAEVFLSKIVDGKGLQTIVDSTGEEPRPTPYSVLEFVRAIREFVPGWAHFALVDIGGATSDFYSAATDRAPPDVVRRGLPEPEIKRSVEGDLGLRISALTAWGVAKDVVSKILPHEPDSGFAASRYIDRISHLPSSLASSRSEIRIDHALASACFVLAMQRHAGRASEVYTADGQVRVHIGRDLSQVEKIIGSGGWLSRDPQFDPRTLSEMFRIDEAGRSVLSPRSFDYYRDTQYLFPLLANAASVVPEEAARTGIESLVLHG
jgi:uncharacterized protein (TIGR01319 family)